MTARAERLLRHGIELVDVRHFWPIEGSAGGLRPVDSTVGQAVHHDAVAMAPGDRDYNGSTLDEDIERLWALRRHSVAMGWGTFPYHLVASPNGRLFYALDVVHLGAHVKYRNSRYVGVALMGNFMAVRPVDAQLCAAAGGIVFVMREMRRLLGWYTHRAVAPSSHPTACPGATWVSWWARLGEFVAVRGR